MDVSNVELASIRPYERNPRLNDVAVDAVAKSLQEFGFRQPIVVDPSGVIVCGHTRWKAATKLGRARVPVHVARDLSTEQLRVCCIADNQTTSIAEWDFETLPIKPKEPQTDGFNFGVTRFAEDALGENLEQIETVVLVDPDDLPEQPDPNRLRPSRFVAVACLTGLGTDGSVGPDPGPCRRGLVGEHPGRRPEALSADNRCRLRPSGDRLQRAAIRAALGAGIGRNWGGIEAPENAKTPGKPRVSQVSVAERGREQVAASWRIRTTRQ